MRTVYKYPLEIDDYVPVKMPRNAEPVHVALQGGRPYVWAVVDTTAPETVRRFRVAGTGHPLEDSGLLYLGTLHTHGGSLVFHVFDMGEVKPS